MLLTKESEMGAICHHLEYNQKHLCWWER